MVVDLAKLPNKAWLAPSDVIAGLVSSDEAAVRAVIEAELPVGKIVMRGRRLVATEVEVDPPMEVIEEPVRGEINLFAGGATWVDREYDERLGPVTKMLPHGEPEAIDAYYLSGNFTLEWRENQLRCEGGPEWHEVRIERIGLVQSLEKGKDEVGSPKRQPGRRNQYTRQLESLLPIARAVNAEHGPYDRDGGITQIQLIELSMEQFRAKYPKETAPSQTTIKNFLRRNGL